MSTTPLIINSKSPYVERFLEISKQVIVAWVEVSRIWWVKKFSESEYGEGVE
jgi:hypothetical protein